jgi:hypothetical protein
VDITRIVVYPSGCAGASECARVLSNRCVQVVWERTWDVRLDGVAVGVDEALRNHEPLDGKPVTWKVCCRAPGVEDRTSPIARAGPPSLLWAGGKYGGTGRHDQSAPACQMGAWA